LALVKKACELAEIVVVSIFVNKAQFNDLSDYEKYPRQFEQDLERLKNSGATHVFLPQDSEIQNEVDGIATLVNHVVYRLKFLK
jgi:pantoate--beta-alanine ligase